MDASLNGMIDLTIGPFEQYCRMLKENSEVGMQT